MDVACGLNPLAIPWMPLAPGAEYRAYDVYPELAAFLNEALPLLGVRSTATVADVTVSPPAEHAQVALVCKALPCLEQLDKAAGSRLLDTLDAQRLLVTYPVRSLGGRRPRSPSGATCGVNQIVGRVDCSPRGQLGEASVKNTSRNLPI